MNSLAHVKVLSLVTLLTWTSLAWASDVQVIALAKHQVVQKKTTSTLGFDLPELQKGRQVRLALLARVDYPSPCANNLAMTAAVNGKPIVGADLLNKPLEYTDKNGRDVFWANFQGNGWYLFSWPDFSIKDVWAYEHPYTVTPGVDPFTFVWDITPYVKLGRNMVSFTHNEIIEVKHSLVLSNVRIEVGDPIKSKTGNVISPAPKGPVPMYVPKERQPVVMEVALGSGGTIRLKVAGHIFLLVSRTSEPNGQWARTTAKRWQPAHLGKSVRTQWICKDYRVTREVTLKEDHLQVADTFTNTSDKLVGVMCEDSLVIRDKPREIKLAGRPPFAGYRQEGGGTNPTALVRWDDMAVGLVAEDDIFRSHAQEFARKDSVGLADLELGIDSGDSHTLEWSVYPIPKGDYWDFINAVRRNWGSNFTIPGPHAFVPWSFGSNSDEYYRQWITARDIKMVTPGDAMFDNGTAAMGTAIPLAKSFCDRTKTWMKQVHKVGPGVKTLFYMNCTYATETGAPEKYADSRLLDGNGNQMTSVAGGLTGITMAPLFISTLDNSYGKAMMNVAKWIVNGIGADGLYHDIFPSIASGVRAFNTTWDGCTVKMDSSTHAVLAKCSSVAILQGPWHTALVDYLCKNNKTIFANGQAETRTELNLHIPAFVEIQLSFSEIIRTHLGCPLAYGNHPVPYPEKGTDACNAYLLRKVLDYGAILTIISWDQEPKGLSFLQLLYPFTPVEIRSGVIFGQERIVTNRSGRFGWLDNSSADAHVFEADGKPISNPQVKEIRENGKVLTEVRMPGDHFAILVKNKDKI